jgi:hypothetical protein
LHMFEKKPRYVNKWMNLLFHHSSCILWWWWWCCFSSCFSSYSLAYYYYYLIKPKLMFLIFKLMPKNLN